MCVTIYVDGCDGLGGGVNVTARFVGRKGGGHGTASCVCMMNKNGWV